MVARNKSFDCVRMKHDIQEQIARETEGMTTAQFVEHAKRGAEAFHRQHAPVNAAPDRKGNFKALFEALELEQEKRGNL